MEFSSLLYVVLHKYFRFLFNKTQINPIHPLWIIVLSQKSSRFLVISPRNWWETSSCQNNWIFPLLISLPPSSESSSVENLKTTNWWIITSEEFVGKLLHPRFNCLPWRYFALKIGSSAKNFSRFYAEIEFLLRSVVSQSMSSLARFVPRNTSINNSKSINTQYWRKFPPAAARDEAFVFYWKMIVIRYSTLTYIFGLQWQINRQIYINNNGEFFLRPFSLPPDVYLRMMYGVEASVCAIKSDS